MLIFVEQRRMPAWVLLCVIAREFAVSALRLVAVDNGRVIAAGWSGKVKTASTMVCICVMLVFAYPALDTVCNAVILVTTVYSGVEYFAKNRDVINPNK
jgi:CDP-diacylglycerol--glycerol-3-phosphate 3-phosphatidyltransferase